MITSLKFSSLAEKRASLSLFIVVISAFFDHVLTFNLGGFFFSPYKFCLLLSILFTIRYLKLSITILFSSVLIFSFSMLVIFQFVSSIKSTLQGVQTISNFVNTFLMLFCYVIWIITTSAALIKSNTLRPIYRLTYILFLCALLTVSIGYIEALTKSPFFQFGIFNEGYSTLTIRGMHTERLFFGEFALCGIFYALYNKLFLDFFTNKPLIILFTIIIVLSMSYSSILNLLLFFFTILIVQYKLISLKGLFLLFFFALLLVLLPFISSLFLSPSDLILLEQKNERYSDPSENWRIFSSLLLLNDFIENPSLFGNGYRNGTSFLDSLNITNNVTSSHTFMSILYNQGFLGFLFFFIHFIFLFYSILNSIFIMRKVKLISMDFYNLGFFVILLLIMSIMRFLFYYQTTFFWIYLYAIVVYFSYTSICNKKLKGFNSYG